MTITLTEDQVRDLRLQAQRLNQPAPAEVVDVVRAVGGIQAQAPAAAGLSIRARCYDVTASQVEQAQAQERSIVRTWLMRGTLHLVASDDLAWLLPLLGPVFSAANRRRRLELGLDDDTVEHGVRALRDVLGTDGPLTRDEIVERLAGQGIELVGQARPHLIAYAAQQGVVCCGPDRDGEPTYVLLRDWLDYKPADNREPALDELARRHLAAFGPATAEDMAAWSGLSLREVRQAWARLDDELVEVATEDGAAWLLKTQAKHLDKAAPKRPPVRLLAAFDTLLLGYRQRRWLLAAENEKRIKTGGGMIPATLLADGRLVGTWRSQTKRKGLTVEVTLFDTLNASLKAPLAAEVADIGQFYGVDSHLTLNE